MTEIISIVCFLLLLAAVAVIDAKTTIIPDGFHPAILACAVLNFFSKEPIFSFETNILPRLIGAVCVSLPMLLLCLLIPGAFGGGDLKLMAVSGLFLGWRLTVLSAVFAIFGGGVWGAGLLLTKKSGRKDHFAFGPFLCAGMAASLFFGDAVINAYLRLCGF